MKLRPGQSGRYADPGSRRVFHPKRTSGGGNSFPHPGNSEGLYTLQIVGNSPHTVISDLQLQESIRELN